MKKLIKIIFALLSGAAIRDKIDSVTGTHSNFIDDYIPAWKEHDSEIFEILVGLTSYPESLDAAKNRHNGRLFDFSGGK